MKREKVSTFEQDGIIYSRSNAKTFRLICRIIGVVLIVRGITLCGSGFLGVFLGVFAIAIGGALFVVAAENGKKKFVSFARPTLAGCHTFGNWNEKVHRGAAQSDRFERAMHDGIAIIGYNAKTGVATISGSTGNKYTTTLDYCSCEDFSKRSKPCKHIYLLASQMGFSGDEFYN